MTARPAATLWELVTPHLGHPQPITVFGSRSGRFHTGLLEHVLLRADGSMVLTFSDDTTIEATSLKSRRSS